MMHSPVYFPAESPDWYIGVTSLFALLADPEDDASEHLLEDLETQQPVLHLAIALNTDVEETYPGEAQWGKQLSMLANPSWLPGCIHRAEVFRTTFAPRTPLGIGPHAMIQVLPAKN